MNKIVIAILALYQLFLFAPCTFAAYPNPEYIIQSSWGQPTAQRAMTFSPAPFDDVQLLDARIHLGVNSMLALATTDSDSLSALLRGATGNSTPSPSSFSSIIGVFSPLRIANVSGIVADGTGNTPADMEDPLHLDTIYLGQNTLLIIPADLAEQTATGLISSMHIWSYSGKRTRVEFADTARLYLANIRYGRRYTIFGPEMVVSDIYAGNLSDAYFYTDSPLLTLTSENNDAKIFTAKIGFVDEIYPRTSAAQQLYLTEALEKDRIGPAHVNSASGGVRLLSRAIDRRYLGADANAVARTLQSAQDMVQAAGVAAMAWQGHQSMLDAMDFRTSFRTADPLAMQPFAPAPNMPLPDAGPLETDGQYAPHGADQFPGNSAGQSAGDSATSVSPAPDNAMSDRSMADRRPSPFALWVRPIFGQWHSSDVASLNPHFTHELDASMAGLVLGADYTLPGLLRAGVSLGLGKGQARGGGDYSDTDNDMRFGAVGAYAALCLDNWLLAAEGAYTDAWHSLEQELDARLDMPVLKANVHTRTYGYKLRQEWRKQFGWLTFTEHMSLGEHWVDTDAYTIKSGGQAVVRGKALQQQIGVFSCGLAVEHVFRLDTDTLGQFWLKPVLDYEITQAYGDIESVHRIELAGMGGMDQKAFSLVSTTEQLTSTVRASLYAGNDVWQFGVSYAHEAGRHRQGNSLTGSLVWHF